MGRFVVNTYLGFRERLQELGMQNLLTGCYCDYMFKGLLLNKRIRPLSRSEALTPFAHQWYVPIFGFDSPEMPAVNDRIEALVPSHLRNKTDQASLFEVQARRLMPLSYEPDTRGVAHRVIRWSATAADNDVLDAFRRTPWQIKLDNRLFLDMMRQVCPDQVLKIPDANTTAPIDAGEFRRFIAKWRKAVGYKIEQRRPKKIATSGSWPDWGYYIAHSEKMKAFWNRKNSIAEELFQRIVGYNALSRQAGWWVENGQLEVILRLITIKIWLDVRIRAHDDQGVGAP
jgi:asparagine synthase (glutamine-hydrolysing)